MDAETQEVEQQEAKPHLEPAVEQMARDTGWVPIEEFRGDPEKWKPAEEWNKRGEFYGILKKDNATLRAELRELKGTVTEFAKHYQNVSQSEYQRAMETILAHQAQAVTDGDGKKFAELEGMKSKLAMPETPGAKLTQEQPTQQVHPHVATFMARNPWYEKDIAMTGAANMYAETLKNSGVPLDQLLPQVEAAIKKDFPHKFQNNAQRSAPSVEGGGEKSGPTGKQSYSALPADARAVCDRFVKQGLLTKDQYVKDYFNSK